MARKGRAWRKRFNKFLKEGRIRQEDDVYVGRTDRGQEVVLGYQGEEETIVNTLLGSRGTVSSSIPSLVIPAHAVFPDPGPSLPPSKIGRWRRYRSIPPSRTIPPREGSPPYDSPDWEFSRPPIDLPEDFIPLPIVSPDPPPERSPVPMPIPGRASEEKKVQRILEAIVGNHPKEGWMDLNGDGEVNVLDAVTMAQRSEAHTKDPIDDVTVGDDGTIYWMGGSIAPEERARKLAELKEKYGPDIGLRGPGYGGDPMPTRTLPRR